MLVFEEDPSSVREWWAQGNDEYPLEWGAALSAAGWVSRGHIKEIRLAADHIGKALQSSTQIDETRQPLTHNLHAINLPCTQ